MFNRLGSASQNPSPVNRLKSSVFDRLGKEERKLGRRWEDIVEEEEAMKNQNLPNKRIEMLQLKVKEESKAKAQIIDELSPIPEGKKRVAKFNIKNDMATLRITVRNDDCVIPKRMIKPLAEVERGHWFLNKYMKIRLLRLRYSPGHRKEGNNE